MQDRYFGDVGDFGKYGLLRALCGVQPQDLALRLGIVWYLVGDETHNSDGKHVGYLDKADKYRICDPKLFDALKGAVSRRRSVTLLPDMGVLPPGTVYFDDRLELSGLQHGKRETSRALWWGAALRATEESQLVFCDPDNGIAIDPVKLLSKFGEKFAGLAELTALRERGQSVIVYHHADRSANVSTQAQRWANQLRGSVTEPVLCLRYRRGTTRLFFVLPSTEHAEALRGRVQRFVGSPWAKHFDLVNV
ncbi:MAG: hypothetical protein ABIQ47_10225 [Tepidiformaceae bacterium]